MPARERRVSRAHGARRHVDRVPAYRRAAAEVGGASRHRRIAAPPRRRIACRARPTDAADAAEVVMQSLPPPNGASACLQLRESRLVDAGLRVDDVRRGVDTRAARPRPRLQAPRRGCPRARSRGRSVSRVAPAAPTASASPGRRRPATAPSCSGGGHPVAGRRTRCPTRRGGCSAARRARGPDARADPEQWVRTHARPVASTATMLVVCRRAVLGGLERPDQGEHTVRRGQTTESWEPGEELGKAGEATARRDAVPVEADDRGVEPARAVVAQVAGREDDASTPRIASAREPR